MEDICNFITQKSASSNINYYHFVYEASFKKLPQPFFYTKYRAFLIFKGEGTLIIDDQQWTLLPGTLLFIHPRLTFRFEGTSNFAYLYISFDGNAAQPLLEKFGITPTNFLFQGLTNLSDFWMTAIRKVNATNATALTESVLLYSLSCIPSLENQPNDTGRFDSIIQYISDHFTDPSLSLKKLADLHFYSEKYLSSLFKKNTGKKFTEYLNNRRISHAVTMMRAHHRSVSGIASSCGFSDPLYFSKVFKKIVGISPSEYLSSQNQNH